MFTNIKNNENVNANQRVSSMMRIVLDNTDNAIAQKTPPPSPKKEQKNTRILSPFFQSFRGTAGNSVYAHRPVPGFVASPPSSRATSPGVASTRKKGHSHNQGAVGSVGSGSSVSSVGSTGSTEGAAGTTTASTTGGSGGTKSQSTDHNSHRKHQQQQHNSHSCGIASAEVNSKANNKSQGKTSVSHNKHHNNNNHAPAGLHKQHRPDTSDLVRIVAAPGEKDVLLG